MSLVKNILRISVIAIFLLVYYNSKAQENFVIKGYVFEQGVNSPLANFPVVIYPDTSDMSEHFTVYTAQNGYFYFTIPFVKPSTLLLELKSYCIDDWQYVYDTIDIYAGVYSKDYYVCSKIDNLKKYIVFGSVVDKETGEPVQDQKIFIYDEKNSMVCHYVNTDEYGYFADTLNVNLSDTLDLIASTESFCNGDRSIISKCIYFIDNTVEVNFEICSKIETSYEVSFFYKMYQNSNRVYFSALCDFVADSIRWDFGDETTGVGDEIYHSYSPGSYKVRIFAYKDGRSYTYSERVVVGKTVTLSGEVYFTDTLCPKGYVVAYKQTKGTTYDIIKTTRITNGSFYFPNLIKGDYIFYAIPEIDLSENYFPKYIATYDSGDNYWQDVETTTIDKNTECILHLAKYEELYYGHNNIAVSADPKLLEQVDIVNVYLLNEQKEIINSKYLTTSKIADAFVNLPDGRYTIVSEVTGQTSVPLTISLNSASNIHVYFYENNGVINSFADAKEISSIVNFKIYPNPFDKSFSVNNQESILVSIFDLSGNKRYEKIIEKNEIITPFDLITGIYIIVIKNKDEQVLSRQIIIKQ